MGVEARGLEDLDRGEAMERGQGDKLPLVQAAHGILQFVQLLDQQVVTRRPCEAHRVHHRHDGRGGLRRGDAAARAKPRRTRPGVALRHQRVRSRHLRPQPVLAPSHNAAGEAFVPALGSVPLALARIIDRARRCVEWALASLRLDARLTDQTAPGFRILDQDAP
jgi:hypothetical protein